ncbi:hypothetical protein [Sedimenticola thiotaurini]|uniref:DUF4412 domain-containing protein n=1 Tax=Sedimenticola thiotaurini TaxID=1543721 RepID=A0A0F7K0E3_9GAMM|nr:hypothetical protein [Sedimenticola thiotaurini]AKH20443.1 hypothetical protein AAY24_08870 [Sedimenticola thiotaurini]
MSIRGQILVLGLCLLLTGIPQVRAASPAAVEFSADTVQTDPQKNQRVGHIFVGKNRVRSESEQNGQPVVSIVDTDSGVTWVLYPRQGSYIEYRMGSGQPVAEAGSPCAGVPGARCKKLGDETLHGRPATKWQVSMPSQKGAVQSTQWIGKQHSILLRQEVKDGPVMEQRMLQVEQFDGRTVEKWEMTVSQGDQPVQRSLRWFDPQLNLAIREESPLGYVRELRNITIAPQNPGLFQVPAEFRKIVPQQQSQKR